jgi:glycosyltransferase involved in cell wall biosynthesis
MNILFIHQAFPGPFHALAPALVRTGHAVVAMTMQQPGVTEWQGVKLAPYAPLRGSAADIHPWLTDFETKVIRGESCFRAAMQLKAEGFSPDLIIAHPGWGESLFIKDVWPAARLGIYCEWFHRPGGADIGFDPEFANTDASEHGRLKLKNLNAALHLDVADGGLAPTRWQADRYPEPFRKAITVIPDGIDTQLIAPNPDVSVTLDGQLSLSRQDEVISFVAPVLEPYMGFHIFMRALPEILSRRPAAHVVIAGGDGTGFGPRPPEGSWKDVFAAEVRPRINDADWLRVHFVGPLADTPRIGLLQLASVHVSLGYPFIQNTTLIEAMSVGAAIVASATPPLDEAITDGETGRLVNFFDSRELADAVCALLDAPQERTRLGNAARAFAVAHHDLESACLPHQLAWAEALGAAQADEESGASAFVPGLKNELTEILSLLR